MSMTKIVCNVVKIHLESKSQRSVNHCVHVLDCVQCSKNTFRKQITTTLMQKKFTHLLCAM